VGAIRVDRRANARNGSVEKKLVYRKIPEQIPVQKYVAAVEFEEESQTGMISRAANGRSLHSPAAAGSVGMTPWSQ
jgi:hypothetical protein